MAERTEAPTPRHLARLRRRGQVAISAELSGALGLLVGVYLLRAWGSDLVGKLERLMRDTFNALARQELTPAVLQARGIELALWSMALMAPLLLGVMAMGVVSTLVQTKGLVALALLKPSLNRISPAVNARRLFSWRGLVEVLKGIGKIAVVGFVVFQSMPDHITRITVASTLGVTEGVRSLGSAVYQIAMRVTVLFLALAVLDYAYQWYQFRQSSRMTREELREELKSAEGSPLMKSRLRQM
ncbi:MAG TPA: EscU/YscU/HrcU family type III secretion system export apparatus switch protein, partial [Caldilineae bacterium]|nr:EscU/YscU/HrcU family type III secretion system export apparatus switch protein [Caldilineae bacterium]